MPKIKKISINAMDKVIKDTYTPTTTIKWNDLEIIIKRVLTFTDVLEFVDNVTKTCFTRDTETYMPEVKDFAIKSNILEKYTNLTLPNNIEHRYEIIYHTDIIETVLNYINNQQFSEMTTSIDAKIKNLNQANIERINKQMSDLNTAFENLQDFIEKALNSINIDDASNLIDTILHENLDEAKLVEAYLEQSKKRADNR